MRMRPWLTAPPEAQDPECLVRDSQFARIGGIRRSRRTLVRQTKPIFLVFRPENGVGGKSKANPGGRAGRNFRSIRRRSGGLRRSQISNLKSKEAGTGALSDSGYKGVPGTEITGQLRQTKPISAFSGLKMGVGRRTKPIQAAGTAAISDPFDCAQDGFADLRSQLQGGSGDEPAGLAGVEQGIGRCLRSVFV